MKPRLYAVIAAIVLLAGWLWFGLRDRHSGEPSAGSQVQRAAPPVAAESVSKASPAISPDEPQLVRLLNQALVTFRARDAAEIDRSLARLNETLAAGRRDPGAGIAAIVAFLRTGEDAPTGKGFVVKQGGVLAEATTLRVYLMDWLGQLARESGDSAAALQMAREILGSFQSADEWAVSLRNVAWLDPASRGYLGERAVAMLAHPAWQQRPTTGMLEAFDIIVHAEALAALPALDDFISRGNNPSLARASGVALHRLAGESPLALASLLNARPELLSAIPLERAGLMAQADLGEPEQLRQMEAYLLRPDVDAREREKFLRSLIQSGTFVSHNLVTPYRTPETPAEARARLEVLTRTLNGWLRDPRFGAFTGELTGLGVTVNEIVDEISADE